MSLESGQQFGPYAVGETIGAGGMGEVFRATDTNLKRNVAMKVLPASFASDADRLARFQREAEVLASLNHPNIAQVYGLEKSGAQTALVMELVDGPTLAERLQQGPIALDDALGIARQIIDALESAHAKGIVHRDLKPANIKLTPEGTVKVLDFGIAKALDRSDGDSGPGQAKLTTPAMTEAGMALGTAAYMSPEQARGRPIDQRTDIWAFGCVLYEMLSGQPAFGGEDRTSTLARVLERKADLQSLPDSIPGSVQQTIARCLEKDPRRRWHHVGDVRLGLEGEFYDSADGVPAGGIDISRPKRWPLVTATAVLAAVVTAITLQAIQPPAIDNSLSPRYTIQTPDNRPLGTTAPLEFSPDGRKLVFMTGFGDNDVYSRPLDRFEAEIVDAGEGVIGLFAAPNGDNVGFASASSNQLMSIGLSGGSPSALSPSLDYFGGAWRADNTLIVVPEWGGPLRVFRPGSAALVDLTTVDFTNGERSHIWPHLLPDNQHVLFTIWSGDPAWDNAELGVANLETGEHRSVLENAVFGRYVDSGHIVFWRGNALWAVPFDRDKLEVSGEPVRVVGDIRLNMGNGGAHFAISKDGDLAYIAGGQNIFIETMVIDRNGDIVRPLDSELPTGSPVYSPDGSRIALTLYRGGIFGVGVFDLERGILGRVWTTGDSLDPAWIDNDRVSFQSSFEGDYLEYAIRADGSGNPEPLFDMPTGIRAGNVSWSNDASTFVYARGDDDTGIWQHEPGNADGPKLIIDSPNDELDPKLSPAGDMIAYWANESGSISVYIRPYPDVDAGRTTVTSAGGRDPTWSADGTMLYYRTDNGVYEVDVSFDSAANLSIGQPRMALAMEGITAYDASPDGATFAVSRTPLETSAREIRVIDNWVEELERLVPVD